MSINEEINKLVKEADKFIEKKLYDFAALNLKRALAMKPDSALLNCKLGDIYLAQNWYSEANEMYIKSLEIDPDNIKAVFGLASVLSDENYENKNYKKAAFLFKSLRKYSKELNDFEKKIKKLNKNIKSGI